VITVVIPSIPPRTTLLNRALASVKAQTALPYEVVVEVDHHRTGAAATRHRGLERVTTPWVAFLDDDDEFLPNHLNDLWTTVLKTGADMVYSWYRVVGGSDPRPQEKDLPWDAENPRQTTITTLVKTGLALEVGGFLPDGEDDLVSPDRHYAGEDWRFTERINRAGVIYHHCSVTWLWHHHGANTSGLPRRW
jgi:glycosyltransferase involved in cell wall biosynthesis